MRSSLLSLLLLLVLATPASASSVSVSFSDDPTEDEPVTVTVSGTSDASRNLYVLRTLSSCASTAYETYYQSSASYLSGGGYGGDGVNGSFNRTYTFTPSEPTTYRICAYIAQSSSGSNDATAEGTVTPRSATASASIAFSSDPTEDEPVSVTVTGTTEVARSLYVLRTQGACASTAYDTYYQSGSATYLSGGGYGGDSVNGSYEHTYTFTPSEASTYRVCVFVAQSSSGTSDAKAQKTVTPRTIRASADVSLSPDPAEDNPFTITVRGTTEVGRTLYALLTPADGCAATAYETYYQSGAIYLSGGGYGGDSVDGAFSRTYTHSVSEPSTYRVCVFIAQGSSVSNDATADVPVAVRGHNATLRIVAAEGPYVPGEQRGFAAAGDFASSGKVVVAARTGRTCGEPPSLWDDEGTAVQGAFSVPGAVTFDSAGEWTLCAWLRSEGRTYATAAQTIAKKPLSPPALEGDAPRGDTRERNPVFSWTAEAGATDTFVLMDAAGEPQLHVDADGAYVLDPSTDEDEEYVDDADDYYDEDAESEESTPSHRRRDLRGAAEWRTDGDRVRVAMTEALPPGRYTWTVIRSRRDGEVTAPTQALRILGPPLTQLSVRAASRAGARSTRPGRTLLRVTATPWAHVRISLRRRGRERVMKFRWDSSPSRALRVDWSCRLPGGRYRYRVVATDDDGGRLSRAGSFSTVTRARCQAMKRSETRALRQRVKTRIRRQQAAERRRQAAERRALQRSIANCHAVYGVVRKLWLDDGTTTLYCVSPYGIWPI